MKHTNDKVEPKPIYVDYWYNLGIVFDELGRHEEAVASYDKALAVKPDLYAAWFNRGIALDRLGHHEEAVASYAQADGCSVN